ncbi:mediator of RNA polymerase II transcription subunit 31 [Oncorhynchus mykiss]|uniref:Mediator of RNA polymerase II transcription subunit 31 n=1 Tax=Oncorhynchus mykiss TaxID=8022 RepID=C1BFD9_ONCMY|nr:mediator of RNA polymerase II transcription subunit 31 [Oncorhynchus mykiss]ACO07742.1 Mediator of RNA polymerase II transcription subunit 31 [Oncorhynchus mykiss]
MAGVMESEEQARNRFQSELEFIQCLANPNYLNFLAQRGYLREKPFVNYLKYLLYWKEPEYAKFLNKEARSLTVGPERHPQVSFFCEALDIIPGLWLNLN